MNKRILVVNKFYYRRDRYNYGILYRGEDGEVYMKRNLKIRFKKS